MVGVTSRIEYALAQMLCYESDENISTAEGDPAARVRLAQRLRCCSAKNNLRSAHRSIQPANGR